VEILPEGRDSLVAAGGAAPGNWAALGAFFGGIALIGVIDRLVPASINPHEPSTVTDKARSRALMHTGVLTALALAIHNFPEGFATFIAALQEPQVGVAVAVAIAIHNIPEGLAVAVPRCLDSRSLPARSSAICCWSPTFPTRYSASCSQASRGSWCLFQSTSSSPPLRSTANTIGPCTE